MAALIRAALCVVVPLLILQLQAVRCEDEEEGGDGGELNESEGPTREQPMDLEELKVTRLQEINTTATKIDELLDLKKEGRCPLDEVEAKIKPLRSAVQVENAVNNALSKINSDGLKVKAEDVNILLCTLGQRFKRHLKSVVSLAELLADKERPEFLEITKNASAVDDEKFKQAMENLNPKQTEKSFKADLNAIMEQVSAKSFGSDLFGRKEQATTKLQAARDQVLSAIKKISDGAAYALNTFFNAMIGVKNVQRELKSTQEYPKDIAQEEARIEKALSAYKALRCSEVNQAKNDNDDDDAADERND